MTRYPDPPVGLLINADEPERVRELLARWLDMAAEQSSEDAQSAVEWARHAHGSELRDALQTARGHDDAAATLEQLADDVRRGPGDDEAGDQA